MHSSMLAQIKNHPILFGLSIALHLVLIAILMVSLNHTTAPKMPPAKKVDTVKAVIIDASVVEKEVQKLRQAEEKERNKKIAKVRYIVEQYFGLSHLHDGAKQARFTDMTKNKFDVWYRQAAFNIARGLKILRVATV